MFCILVFLVTYYNMYSIGEVKTIMCHPSFDHLIVRFNGKAKLAKYVLTAGSSSEQVVTAAEKLYTGH